MSGAPEGFDVSFPIPYMGQGLDSSSNSTRRYTRHVILNIGDYQLTYLYPTQILQGYYHASSSCQSAYAVTMVGIYLFTDPHDPSRKAFTWGELVNVLRLFIRRIWNTAKRWAHCARFRIQTTTEDI
ncbi:hypothetical protein EDD85DRAFT_1028415 [Armillaria nabsnona]|nr:hypothetical protein EDD85DRAFT_1028415 [Armillaria nabsnona]